MEEQRYTRCTVSVTSALGGGSWATPRPCRFTRRKDTRYPLCRRMVGPQGRSGRVRKISLPPGFDPQTFQPAASHYSDIILTKEHSSSKRKSCLTIHFVCHKTHMDRYVIEPGPPRWAMKQTTVKLIVNNHHVTRDGSIRPCRNQKYQQSFYRARVTLTYYNSIINNLISHWEGTAVPVTRRTPSVTYVRICWQWCEVQKHTANI